MTLDVRSLRSFIAIATAGSISRAADSLHIAQPALSLQVKQLEIHLGTSLFDRHARGVTLTSAGDRLLVHAVAILRLVDVACEDIRSAVDEPSGPVSLALPQSVAKFITVPLVQEVIRRWPKIQVQIIEMSTGYIPAQLLRGQIDIGVVFVSEDDARLQFKHIMDEELVLVTSVQQLAKQKSSVRNHNQSIDLRSIAPFPMILPTSAHSLRRRIEEYLLNEKTALNVIAEVNAIPELIELVVAGIGSTVLSYAAVKEHVMSSRLIALKIQNPQMTRSIYSCRSGIVPLSIAATRVRELLHEIMDALVASGKWPHATTPVL